MARKIVTLVAALGAVGSASAIQPSGSSHHSVPAEGDAQLALVELRLQNQVAEMTANELLQELGVESALVDTISQVVVGFGKDLLKALKPSVEGACIGLAKELSAPQPEAGDEDDDEEASGFTQLSTDNLKSIAMHTGAPDASFVETQFIKKLKGALKKAASTVSKIAKPVLEKAKKSVLAVLKTVLHNKLMPILAEKASNLISLTCKRAKTKVKTAPNAEE